jgi:enterochelin esterase-like enzyme
MRIRRLILFFAVVVVLAVGGVLTRAPFETLLHRYQEYSVLHEKMKGHLYRLYVKSEILHRRNKVFVYLPPGYGKTQESYPVVYLLHGTPGESRDWFVKGRAHATAERLILDGKIRPMILVCADGFGPGGVRDRTDYLNSPRRHLYVEDYFAHELPDYVDSRFRTIRRADGRIMTGLSAGGFGAANIGTKHPDRFRTLCSHSGFFDPKDDYNVARRMLGPRGPAWDESNPLRRALRGEIDPRLHFYLDAGRNDDLLDENQEFSRALARHGVPHVFRTVDGGHHWIVWRRQFRYSLAFVETCLRKMGVAETDRNSPVPYRSRR